MDPQQQPVAGEEAKMEVDANASGSNNNTEQQQQQMSKRARLMDLNEHLKVAGCSFLEMDFEFRDNYMALERDIRKEEEEKNQFKNELYEKLGLAKDCRSQIDSIIADNTPDAQPLRNMVSELMCCNTVFYKQLTLEKDSLAEENLKLKQQMQQEREEKEAINASNKRARPAPYNFGNMTNKPTPVAASPIRKEVTLPSVANNNNSSVAGSSGRQVYSFLDSGKPTVTKALNNEMINGLVNPKLTGYEKRNDYTTNSLSQYKMYQQFDMACNGANPYQ